MPVQQPPLASRFPIGRPPATQMSMANTLSAETKAWMEAPSALQPGGHETQQGAMVVPQRMDSSNSALWSTPTLATEHSPLSPLSDDPVHVVPVGIATNSASDGERVVTPVNTTQALEVRL